MKKVIAAGAVLLLASSAQLSYAGNQKVEQQVSHRDWAISGYIGVADFENEEKPDPFRPGVSHEFESDKALTGGVILSKYYNDFSFNFGIKFMQEIDITDEEDNEIGAHSHIPISLGVNYHFDTSIVNPYIGAGIGYSLNDSTESDFIAGQGVSMETDDSIFYYLTAGVEYPVSDSYAVFLAGQYTMSDVDIDGSIQTPNGSIEMENEGTLDRYEVNMGVKYFF